MNRYIFIWYTSTILYYQNDKYFFAQSMHYKWRKNSHAHGLLGFFGAQKAMLHTCAVAIAMNWRKYNNWRRETFCSPGEKYFVTNNKAHLLFYFISYFFYFQPCQGYHQQCLADLQETKKKIRRYYQNHVPLDKF